MRRFSPLPLLFLVFAAAARPAAADPAPVDRRIGEPGGASLTVATIDLRRASIVLSVTIDNPGIRELRLNQAGSFVLGDDAHGVHHLNPPPDDPELVIPARSQRSGELVFIGPLAPSARQLTVSGGAFTATLPVAAPSTASEIGQADHRDGAALRLLRIVASGDACLVSLLATNGTGRTIVLNQKRSLKLTDRNRVSAPIKEPAENRELVVPAGDRLDASLVFDCRSLDTGAPLTLSINQVAGDAADKADDALPAFTLASAVERQAEATTPAGSHATVAPIAWSRLSPSAAPPIAAAPPAAPAAGPANPGPPPASSRPDAARLEAALQARKTERGLRLALPADALFGAGAYALDPAAAPLLGRLAELIAATQMREVVVTVHAGAGAKGADSSDLAKRRADAVVAWLEGHAPVPHPRFAAKTEIGARPAAPKDNVGDPGTANERQRNAWVDVILRRDYLVPNRRSPASPRPGKI